LLASNKK